ncbi:hypothetical protein BpHYR1_008671 [Brachionus plicatilis]|uniref:Uncharacterized protein n=1 Tax=Brachionus plicatilis TaxID=10195 RepID=A0A3M7QGN0_BRAPC|nr:hypothetical protein BpHYR1_008671 [Brachionus plicatilis]
MTLNFIDLRTNDDKFTFWPVDYNCVVTKTTQALGLNPSNFQFRTILPELLQVTNNKTKVIDQIEVQNVGSEFDLDEQENLVPIIRLNIINNNSLVQIII